MRAASLLLLACEVFGCAAQQETAQPTIVSDRIELLREYGFTSCLSAGGARSQASDEAEAFYLESADDPARFEAVARCAEVYVKSRRNVLNRKLVIPYCLDFLRSAQLKGAMAAKMDAVPDCVAATSPSIHPTPSARQPTVD